MHKKIGLLALAVVITAILIAACISMIQKGKVIDSQLQPIMEAFEEKAKTLEYEVANGRMIYNGALKEELDARDDILKKYGCLPGKWETYETETGKVSVKFNTYHCPFSPLRKSHFLD